MYRRRYVALVGVGLLAGCGTDGGGTPTAASTPTDAGAQTDAEPVAEATTETDAGADPETDTGEVTGTRRAAAELDAAAAKVRDAHDVYLDYAGRDATVLLDVGPETESYNGNRVQTICAQASDHVSAAQADAGTHQQPPIQRLASAATWLSGAAGVQESLTTVAEYLRQTERTASGGAPPRIVASHLRSARDAIGESRSIAERVEAPRNNAFEEFDGIDSEDVEAKHRQLWSEASGLADLAGLSDEVIGPAGGDGEAGGAIGTLQAAGDAFDADEYDRAEALAEAAAGTFEGDILERTDSVEPDSLRPLVGSFDGVAEALRERAGEIREEAAAGGS